MELKEELKAATQNLAVKDLLIVFLVVALTLYKIAISIIFKILAHFLVVAREKVSSLLKILL